MSLGWGYPAGVTQAQIDALFGGDDDDDRDEEDEQCQIADAWLNEEMGK